MRGPLTVILEHTAGQLPGLIFVTAGMSMLAAAVLVPAWLANQRLADRHAVLAHQAQLFADQRQRYSDFHDALAAGDPQLLQRLAYAQLHVRPADGHPWPDDDLGWRSVGDDRLAMTGSIDAALAEPVTSLRAPDPVDAPPTRLVRLATGTSRIGLMAAAFCFVVGGLAYGSRPQS